MAKGGLPAGGMHLQHLLAPLHGTWSRIVRRGGVLRFRCSSAPARLGLPAQVLDRGTTFSPGTRGALRVRQRTVRVLALVLVNPLARYSRAPHCHLHQRREAPCREAGPGHSTRALEIGRNNMRSPLDSIVLRYLLEVAEAGSIRRASDQLFVSASSINRRILNLEEKIGVPVFERQPRGVRPTKAGEIILAAARELDRSIADALLEVAALQGLGHGRVSFGAVASCSDIAAHAIGRLRRSHPGMSVQCFVGSSSEVVRRLVERKLAFGICWNPPSSAALRRINCVTVPIGAALLPGHPLAERADVQLRDCLEYPMAFPAMGMELRNVLDRMYVSVGAGLMAPAVEVNALGTLRRMATTSPDGAVISANALLEELETGTSVLRPLRDLGREHFTLTLLATETSGDSSAASVLMNELSQQLDGLRGRLGALFPSGDAGRP